MQECLHSTRKRSGRQRTRSGGKIGESTEATTSSGRTSKQPRKQPAAPSSTEGSARKTIRNNEDVPQAWQAFARAEAVRRSMSSTLKDAAEAALASNAVRKADAQEKQRGASGGRNAAPENKTSTIGPALLTAGGEREAKEKRTNWLVFAAITLLIGGCSWLMLNQSPEQAALLAVVSPPEQIGGEWQAPHRIATIQRRTWLPESNMPAAMNLDDANFRNRYRYTWGQAAQTYLTEQLADCQLVMISGAEHWAPTEHLSTIGSVTNEMQTEWRNKRPFP